ncbi:MAG TPA: glycosyltransferase family 4 protein [Nannocystis sp.]
MHFLVPGSLDRLTGGTIYDKRVVAELRRLGHDVIVHELEGRFPWPDGAAHASSASALEAVGPGDALVLDGLALAAVDPASELPPGVPRILLVHMPLAEERGLPYSVRVRLYAAEDAWLRRADRVLCTSPVVAAELARRGAPEWRIGVVEPGVDAAGSGAAADGGRRMDAGREADGSERVAEGAEESPVRLLSVGAVTRVKAHVVLVRALARLSHLPWTLEIVGSRAFEPATGAALRAEIDRRGLAGRVVLAGELPHEAVCEAYRRADVFVLPSLFESYGMALAEAAAHGLPLVASEVGGIPATPAGRAARLVPPGDDVALARVLEPLILDPGERARLAAAATAAAAELGSWADVGEAFAREIHVARG